MLLQHNCKFLLSRLVISLKVLDHCGVDIESVLNSQCSYPRVVESLYAEAGGRREEGGGRSVDSVEGEAGVEVYLLVFMYVLCVCVCVCVCSATLTLHVGLKVP